MHLSQASGLPAARPSVVKLTPSPGAARRFGCLDKAVQRRLLSQYRARLESWQSSSFADAKDGEDVLLRDMLSLGLNHTSEFHDPPVARYEAWRKRASAVACLRLVALTIFDMTDQRAGQIETALFAPRPADEISPVGTSEIRKVLRAHRVYGEFQRDEIHRERPSITSLAS